MLVSCEVIQRNKKFIVFLLFSFLIFNTSFVFAIPSIILNETNRSTFFITTIPFVKLGEGNITPVIVNMSDYWDNLDTPADINAGDITDDNTYALVTGETFTGNIIVNGNLTSDGLNIFGDSYFNGSLYPLTSLTYDIGSGAFRWRNIYATNLSIDNIDVSGDINILGDITAPFGNFTSLFTDGVNISDLDNIYLNLSGTNADRDINIGAYTFSADEINTNCVSGGAIEFGQCGANVRLNLTLGGNLYGIGPWDTDDSITASSDLIVRRSRALPYLITHINRQGLAIYDNSASDNLMINLTIGGNYFGVGNVTADWGKFTNLNVTGLIYGNGSQLTGISAGFENPATEDLNMSGYNITNADRISGDGDNVKIGSGDDARSLTSSNDLLVSGKLETTGISYFNNRVQVSRSIASNPQFMTFEWNYDNPLFYIDGRLDEGIHLSPRAANGIGNNNILITPDGSRTKDFDHDTQSTNPTLFIHSATNPDTDNTQWISFTHNQTDGIIDVGKGNITLKDDTTIEGNSFITGNVGIGTNSPNVILDIGDTLGTPINPEARVSVGNDDGLSGYSMGVDVDNRSWMLWDNDGYFEIGTREKGVSYGNTIAITSGRVGIGTSTPSHELNVVGNVNVTGNLTVDTIFAKAINISNSSFSFTHDENNSISYSIQNTDSGSNATSLIRTLNNVGGIFGIGIASSNYLLGNMLMPNMTALFSRSQGEMTFINTFNQAFVWYVNPSNDNDVNNLVEVMRLDENGLNVSGNFTGNQFYGEMWNYTANVSAWTFSIASASFYYNLTGLEAGELNGFTFTSETQANGGSYLTAGVAGLYNVVFDISFEATTAGGLYGFATVKNYDVSLNRKCYARRYGTGNAGSVANGCLIRLDVGDTVNIQIEDEFDPPKDIKIHTVTLKLIRIGD